MEILETISQKSLDFLFHFGPKVLLAIFLLVIGFWLIKKMLIGMDKLMSKSRYDTTLQRFFHNLTRWTRSVNVYQMAFFVHQNKTRNAINVIILSYR